MVGHNELALNVNLELFQRENVLREIWIIWTFFISYRFFLRKCPNVSTLIELKAFSSSMRIQFIHKAHVFLIYYLLQWYVEIQPGWGEEGERSKLW